MVKKIKLIPTLKSKFKYIKFWSKIDSPDFINKNSVTLKITDKAIINSFNLEEDLLHLEFAVSNSFVSYGNLSSVYALDEQTLLKIAKNNGYMVMIIPESLDFETDIIPLYKTLIDYNIQIIPLEYKVLIRTDEPTVYEHNGHDFTAEEINE